MELRQFGTTALRVSPLGIGCARIGGIFQGGASDFVSLLQRAADAGINFFDTADMYSQGESETLLGKALRGRRDQMVIASKAGYVLPTQRRVIARIKPLVRPLIKLLKISRASLPSGVRGAPTQEFEPAYLQRAVEASLKRLRTDRLDLFQLHSPPAAVITRGAWLPAAESLLRAGKIRYFGIACDLPEDALEALKFPIVSSVQVTVSLLEQRALDHLLPAARARGVAVIAREVLANGLLVKKADELDLAGYCRSSEQIAQRKRQLEALREAAAERKIALPQLALDFARSVEGASVALLGVRSLAQLEGLLRIPHAPVADLSALRAI
jgi:aryl-alcohol dehydrogenase-like predicted oxidoreductase